LGEPLDKPTELSRSEPEFVAAGSSHGEPLDDATVSRRPIVFAVTADGGVWIDIGASGAAVTIGGQRINGKVMLSAEDISRGAVIALGKRVVLLLHSISALDDVLDSAEASIAPEMIGSSVGLRRVLLDIRNVADTDKHVLIRGETGSGKELVAQAIHRASKRRNKPLVAVNVAGVTPTLAEAEFFGVEKNAFNGATKRLGYFEQASSGTLFLDEIGDIPSTIQPTLLRAIDNGEIQPVGAEKPRKVDVRIVSATDANLDNKIAKSGFSEALHQRLKRYEIWIPPLRERRDDIGLLLARFLQEELASIGESKRLDVPDDGSTPWLPASIVAQLIDYNWPGNIRELKNVIGQIVLSNRHKSRVEMPVAVQRQLEKQAPQVRPQAVDGAAPSATPNPLPAPEPNISEPRRPADVKENELREALRGCRWDLNATSKQLGISRASMYILKERFTWFHVAGDLKIEEIQQCHDTCGGNLSQMAERLEVSEQALKRRIRELGLTLK
jgi:two-component system nitrogen regulation response regulator GlnG